MSKHDDCWICQSLEKDRHLTFYESPVSVGKLNPDQYFLGYSFVVFKWHETELYHLNDQDRRVFLEDMSIIARALASTFKPDKMNYELLGNGQPHLHWHLVPRYRTDPLWGRPIWTGGTRRKRLTRENYEDLARRIQMHL